MPATFGVPLMVIVLFANDAETPAGKLVAAPIPEAPIVVNVIFGKGELMHSVRLGSKFPPRLSLNCAIAVSDSAEP